ncbi:MAG: tetratricopeptide repeat protein [Pirellulaceae bacterium]
MMHQASGRPGVAVVWVLGAWLFVAAGGVTGHGDELLGLPQEEAAAPADLEARIAQLIEQLGASEYATRERAQTELLRLRLDAFDALNEAQFSDDIEIALSAQYLVSSMQVNWSSEDDSPEVKQLLRGYGNRPENERRNLIEQLSMLGAAQAVRPLCRLVRYEASERLSKHAALLVMEFPLSDEEAARVGLAAALRAKMGKSKRTAAEWLRTYALWLDNDPAAADRWKELTDLEQARLVDSPDQTSREITRDVLKWYADQLTRHGQSQEALAVMRNMTTLLNSMPQEILDAVDWFRDRQSWAIVVEIAAQFPETFKHSPLLLYRLAEAYRQQGNQAKAEESAQQALAATPEGPENHLELAANLQQDGLFEWAEVEFRHVAKMMDSEPLEAIRAKLYLSEMLHELRKDQAAAEVLQEVVNSIEESQDIRTLVETELGRDVGSTKSRLFFFYAEHQASLGNTARRRELLLEGYKHDPNDADLLIGMFRVPEPDEAWIKDTRMRIETATESFRQQIKELQDRVNAQAGEDRALASFQLALINNQLAWLIANTEGDADEAIKCSLQSLALLPDRSGFLDTLGRCYYAKGDLANAIKFQTRAVALDPHSPTMLAQLEFFQNTQRERDAAKEPAREPQEQP